MHKHFEATPQPDDETIEQDRWEVTCDTHKDFWLVLDELSEAQARRLAGTLNQIEADD